MAHERHADTKRISRKRYHARNGSRHIASFRADGKTRALWAGRAIGPPALLVVVIAA